MVTHDAAKRCARSAVSRLPRRFRGDIHVARVGRVRVRSVLHPPEVQRKLTVSPAGDIHEQEADRIADEVMHMPDAAARDGTAQRVCAECQGELAQRDAAEADENDEEVVQAKRATGAVPAVTTEVEAGVASLKGGGIPLPQSAKSFFEPRFARDFRDVRVHTDARAAETARAIDARAYTLGNDVVFGQGEYAPGTVEGRRLLAHELTHVAQQMGGSRSSTPIVPTGRVQRSVQTAYNNYTGRCACGQVLGNNCAHYLSDAFIRAGYGELDGGVGALYRVHNGRVVCRAGRPVRARELRTWFAGRATATSHGEPTDHRYWAVFQRDGYWGGHVVIHHHAGAGYTSHGTGDYPGWATQDHYTW